MMQRLLDSAERRNLPYIALAMFARDCAILAHRGERSQYSWLLKFAMPRYDFEKMISSNLIILEEADDDDPLMLIVRHALDACYGAAWGVSPRGYVLRAIETAMDYVPAKTLRKRFARYNQPAVAALDEDHLDLLLELVPPLPIPGGDP